MKISLLDEYNTLIIVSHDIVNSLAISDQVLILAKEEGKEGATIIEDICLASLDLAWRKDIYKDKKFLEVVDHVKEII